jgi:CRP-like cAMP-binding protein
MTESLDYFIFLDTINPQDAKIIHSLFQPKMVKKNTYLLREGQVCEDNYIITKGVAIKSFNLDNKEITTDIYLIGDIAFSFDSFTYQTKSTESIIAITDLELLSIKYQDYTEAKAKYPWLVKYDTIFMERYIVQLEHKLKELTTLNAAQRYEKILTHHTKLLQEVPLKIIASYLNVSVERLSRIRAQI